MMTAAAHYLANYPFPAEKAAPHFQFTINDIRDGSSYYNAPPHAHTHTYFEIFLIEKGGGLHVIDEQTWPMEDQAVHILQPGVPHYMQRNEATRGWVIVFSLEVLAGDTNAISNSLAGFFRNMLAEPVAALSSRSFGELLTILKLMNAGKNVKMPSAEHSTYIRSLFTALLLTIKPHFSIRHKPGAGGTLSIVHRFHELVSRYYGDGLPVGDYASRLGTTEKTLTRALKKHGDTTPAKVIRERVILEAARMLHHTDHSVKEIAYHLHFSDPAHFVKVFRAGKGITPLAYRNSCR